MCVNDFCAFVTWSNTISFKRVLKLVLLCYWNVASDFDWTNYFYNDWNEYVFTNCTRTCILKDKIVFYSEPYSCIDWCFCYNELTIYMNIT